MNQNNSGFLSSIPPVTRNLLIINVLVWLAQFLFLQRGIDVSDTFGLHYFKSQDFHWYQVITYMFLHDPRSIAHVLFNMFAVFMFGRVLETIWGPKKFLIYYLVCGLGAALVQILVIHLRVQALSVDVPTEILHDIYTKGADILRNNQNYTNETIGSLNLLVNISTVGASGAVFGILVAFGMIFPNVELMIMFIPIPIKAKWFVLGYGVVELLLGFGNFSGDNVAHFAHLGGLFTGLIMLLYWRKKGTLHGNLRQH